MTSKICIFYTKKKVVLLALHVHFSNLDIFKTFSFFLRREMTCFPVVWTTWAYAYDDNIQFLSSYLWCAGTNLFRDWTQFSSVMTWKNCEMIAEKRSDIFRRSSRCRRRRVCVSLQSWTRDYLLFPLSLVGRTGVKFSRRSRLLTAGRRHLLLACFRVGGWNKKSFCLVMSSKQVLFSSVTFLTIGSYNFLSPLTNRDRSV